MKKKIKNSQPQTKFTGSYKKKSVAHSFVCCNLSFISVLFERLTFLLTTTQSNLFKQTPS